ncbi:hypothetical protein IAI39_11540, partial [Streptococcus pseudopneumoniae]|uniref:hypothetical protein n=1 Tax=Streptococcus pseudopneumoniae TaxID=257758 RepID=UPI0018B0D879
LWEMPYKSVKAASEIAGILREQREQRIDIACGDKLLNAVFARWADIDAVAVDEVAHSVRSLRPPVFLGVQGAKQSLPPLYVPLHV